MSQHPTSGSAKLVSLVILVIDDEVEILEGLRDALSPEGMRVIPARSGDEALRILSELGALDGSGGRGSADRINAVLMDWIMAGPSGDELFAQLKAIDAGLPIVVLSARSGIQLPTGAAGMIAKPFELEELITKLREIARP